VPLFAKQYNLVPVVKGKVTVGLVLHWSRVMDSVIYPPTGSMAIKKDEYLAYAPEGHSML